MGYIKREKIEQLIESRPSCYDKSENNEELITELESVIEEKKKVLKENNVKYAGTWLLERDLWLMSEKNESECETATLSRGRIVLVNPGVTNIGREQKYVHPYIVLGEYKETFIGVPITNMARNKKTGEYYFRHFFEVELVNPEGEKPFNEYRCNKPSVADVRNIAGLDKRRIIKDKLYYDQKFAPNSYLNAISDKIRCSFAIIVDEETNNNGETEEDS
jgi:hypothetical protein